MLDDYTVLGYLVFHWSLLPSSTSDQSSELSVALKRSQTELATALADLESLRSHSRTVQVSYMLQHC